MGLCRTYPEKPMKIKLVSFALCPFVQRAVITLKEKGVAFDIDYIDLESPPDWFQKLSPLGKVPLLQVEDEVLFESAVILDYLDEVYAPRLHPLESLRRAQHKAWIEFGSDLLVQQYGLALSQGEDEFEEKLSALSVMMKRLEEPLGRGLFGNQGQFTLVDAAYAPLFMRMGILGELQPAVAESYAGPLSDWADTLLARPSVSASVVADFAPRYLQFLEAKGSWLKA